MTYHTIQIPRDTKSIRYYVEKYKAFRLLSLKTAPEAFGSTYAREIAFTDDVWYNRLANPMATTFIAMESDSIVCTMTAIGPLPCTVEESSPGRNPWIPINPDSSEDPKKLHYQFNGMFSLPEARGKGVAKTIIKHAMKVGTKEALKSGQVYTASIVVDANNPVAIALYKKCGFAAIRDEVMPNTTRLLVLMGYTAKDINDNEEIEVP